MYPWIIILLVTAVVVFGLDYLFRRKKWKDNTTGEKISLIINMLSVAPYIFLSALGMLWGITGSGAETAFGKVLYDATLMLGGIYFIVAIAAVILSFVFRKIGKIKASIWINVISIAYIIVVTLVNFFASELL